MRSPYEIAQMHAIKSIIVLTLSNVIQCVESHGFNQIETIFTLLSSFFEDELKAVETEFHLFYLCKNRCDNLVSYLPSMFILFIYEKNTCLEKSKSLNSCHDQTISMAGSNIVRNFFYHVSTRY